MKKQQSKHLHLTFFPFQLLLRKKTLVLPAHHSRDCLYCGYCCDSINKKLKCEECKLRIVSSDVDDTSLNYSLIKGISSGNLFHPNADILHIGIISYIVIQKIACFGRISQVKLTTCSFSQFNFSYTGG